MYSWGMKTNLIEAVASEAVGYVVTLRFQYPSWDEKEGVEFNVTAKTKSEAIKKVKRQTEWEGVSGTGCLKGMQWWSAKEGSSDSARTI